MALCELKQEVGVAVSPPYHHTGSWQGIRRSVPKDDYSVYEREHITVMKFLS
jgi:hypothetical protein